MKKGIKAFLGIVVLVGLSLALVSFFKPQWVNDLMKPYRINQLQKELKLGKEGLYLRKEEVINQVAGLVQSKGDYDPEIYPILVKSLLRFDRGEMSDYHYKLVNYEGVDQANLLGHLDKNKGLFKEEVRNNQGKVLDQQVYERGQLKISGSAPKSGKLQDLIEPKGLFGDLLIRPDRSTKAQLSQKDGQWLISGEVDKSNAKYSYGQYELAVDQKSYAVTRYVLKQGNQVVQSIHLVSEKKD